MCCRTESISEQSREGCASLWPTNKQIVQHTVAPGLLCLTATTGGENQNLATVTYQVNLSRRSLCNSHALRRSTYATCIVPPVSSDNHRTASRRSQIRDVCVPGCGTSMQQWKETESSISDETEGGLKAAQPLAVSRGPHDLL